MFIPADGCVLVDADYSQIELRLLAHISGDEAMRSAFLSGGDFHAQTAAKVFRVDPADVTHEMRRRAKAVNFGIVYGISAFSLSQDIGVTVAEAKDYMDAYFATFPGVRRYMDDIVERAKADGYVETLFHRRRDLPELTSSNHNLRAFGERVALNMPIQGTAADIMKLAMVAVRQAAEGGAAGGPAGAPGPRRADRGVPGAAGGDRRPAAAAGDGERGLPLRAPDGGRPLGQKLAGGQGRIEKIRDKR